MSSLVSSSVFALALAAILCGGPLVSNARRIRATVRARRSDAGPRLRG